MKWVKKFEVKSSSSDEMYIVAIDNEGNYGCSCPAWKFRRIQCHHIKQIQNGDGKLIVRPTTVLASINTPIYKEKTNELWIPLVGIPDAMMMEATICFHLLEHGYSISEIRDIRGHIPNDWTARKIRLHVEVNGQAVYPDGWYTH